MHRPPEPPGSFIFLRNFNDFPPHIEGELKLGFCDCAWCLALQDPRILQSAEISQARIDHAARLKGAPRACVAEGLPKLEWNQNDQLQGAKFSNQPDSCNQTTLVTRRWSNLTVTISSNTSVAGSSPPGWAPQRKGAVQSEGDLGMKVQNAWHVWLP